VVRREIARTRVELGETAAALALAGIILVMRGRRS